MKFSESERLYRENLSTVHKIMRMGKPAHKWFMKNDAGYQWMARHFFWKLWLVLLVLAILSDLYQASY